MSGSDTRRRRGTGGLAVIGVVATVAMVRAVLPGGDEGSSLVAVSPADAGDPLFLVPGAPLPDGFELLEASSGDQPGVGTSTEVAPDWDGIQRWVRFDEAGEHPVDVIDIGGSLFLASADRYVQWVEPDGERVTLSALGMTDDEVLALADGLEVVDAEVWSALQEDLAPEPEVAGPSASAPPSTAPPTSGAPATATTAGAPAGQVQIAGSYEGTERYMLTTGRCDLDHVLDTTWSASDGTTWTFHQEDCGLLDGDFWTYGGGSFTLTAPDGATLTGDARTHSALAPTYTNRDGPGITLDIQDGTGRFAGATGQCTLMNHVTQVTFGEQRQDGTFTCDFTP